jgi:hypothetical protein
MTVMREKKNIYQIKLHHILQDYSHEKLFIY